MENIDAWAAGFFDGEGCIVTPEHYSKTSVKYKLPVVQCTQSERRRNALDRLQNHYSGFISPMTRALRWQIHKADDAVNFLKAIEPYTIAKKNLVEAALIAFQTKGKSGVKLSTEMVKLREVAIKRIRNINQYRTNR